MEFLTTASLLLSLPLYQPKSFVGDWLLDQGPRQVGVYRTADGLAISNGFVSRVFRLEPNATTVELENHMTGESMLRAVGPESIVEINGTPVPIGGLTGQPNRAYLDPAWVAGLQPVPGALKFRRFQVGEAEERLVWKRVRPGSSAPWPPNGVSLTMTFGREDGLEVDLRYEAYRDVPALAKRMIVRNGTGSPITVSGFSLESLSLTEVESNVDTSPTWRLPAIGTFTDYSFGGMAVSSSNRTAYWELEPEYETQVNYEKRMPCRLVVKPPSGPDKILVPGESLETFWSFLLFHDSTERERQGLAVRKLVRTLCPWSGDNPLMLHLTSTNPEVVKRAIDQAADVGFEMVILSFGSGLNMEDDSPANTAKFREFRAYASAKGLEFGGYSLLASRRIDDANDVINPKTGTTGGAIFGNSPCLESQWGQAYFARLRRFLTETGFNLLEHDGSYPGDVCASTSHPGHRGLADSQWNQFQRIAYLYRWCLANGIYLNVPDTYFFAGSNKTGMGYRETNWSLPRAQQHIHARQNLFDGTWEKTPSMGWMMVPLVEYHGGGPAATIEPLKDHLEDYGLHLANNLGYGAQACYRGPRLYDSPETREVVLKWVRWFKKHRAILESDVVHWRRADGRRLDGVVHVNPALKTKAMAVIYNPLDRPITEQITLPLYYSGLKGRIRMSVDDGPAQGKRLDPQSRVTLRLTVPVRGMRWIAFEG